MMAPNALPADTPRTFTVFQLQDPSRFYTQGSLGGYDNQILQQCRDYAWPVQDVTNSLFPGFINPKKTKWMWACEGNDIGVEIGNSGVNVGLTQSQAVEKGGHWGHAKNTKKYNKFSPHCDSRKNAMRYCHDHCSNEAAVALSALSGKGNDPCGMTLKTGVEVPGIGLLGATNGGTPKTDCEHDSCCVWQCNRNLNMNFNPLAPSSTMNAIGATPFGKLFGRELDDEHKEAAETPIVV